MKIKKFVVTPMDMKKISTRGCRVCKSTSFKYYRLSQKAICNNCGATYLEASEGLLDEMGKATTSFEVVRYSNTENPGENYTVETEKKGYTRKKILVSDR